MNQVRGTHSHGFTLIEVLVFIIITGMVMTTLLKSAETALRKTPTTHYQLVALHTAQQCMEWFVGQRHLISYASITCPSTPAPTACTAPAGFTVSTSIACTTRTSDANYKTITVTVAGNANASISSLIGSY
jgi:Tfp pilus assembly protein PilV